MRERLERLTARLRRPEIGLATVALGVTAVLVVFFFPARESPTPRVELLWPRGAAPQAVGALDPVPAWPGSPLRLRGRGFTPFGSLSVRIGGRGVATLPVDDEGRVDGLVRVPAFDRPGPRAVALRDEGNGRRVATDATVWIVRGPEPVAWAGPSPLARNAALVVAAGLAPGTTARVALDPDGPAPVALGDAVVRRTGRLSLVVGIDTEVPNGGHIVEVIDDQGRSARAALAIER